MRLATALLTLAICAALSAGLGLAPALWGPAPAHAMDEKESEAPDERPSDNGDPDVRETRPPAGPDRRTGPDDKPAQPPATPERPADDEFEPDDFEPDDDFEPEDDFEPDWDQDDDTAEDEEDYE